MHIYVINIRATEENKNTDCIYPKSLRPYQIVRDFRKPFLALIPQHLLQKQPISCVLAESNHVLPVNDVLCNNSECNDYNDQ